MTAQQWIGFGLLIPLLAFFFYAYIKGGAFTKSQNDILRLMAMLVGGFAAAFIAGDAIVSFTGKLSTGAEYAVKGTAGAAFAFLIWWTWGKFVAPDTFPDVKDVSVKIGNNTTFDQAISTLTGSMGYVYELVGFSDEQKNALLKPQQVNGSDICDFIKKLRFISTVATPNYTIEEQNHELKIKVTP